MKKDICITILFFLFIFIASIFLSKIKEANYGYEYHYIAQSLVNGKGFSNPFSGDSINIEKTAWMPPFLSYLQALIYTIFGLGTEKSFFALLFITKAVIAFSVFLLIRLSNEVNTKYRHLSLVLFFGYILINPKQLLLSFHDQWLTLFFSIAIIYVIYFHFIKKSLSIKPVLLLSILLPVVSPILSFSFLCILFFFFIKDLIFILKAYKSKYRFIKEVKISFSKYSVILLIFMIPVIVWSTRNYLVFDKFIPIKSNLWFDFYQANVFDEDGLITLFTFTNFHPIMNDAKFREYTGLGEVKFIEHYKKESAAYLNQNYKDYISKVVNRLYAIFVYAKHPFDLRARFDDKLIPDSDKTALKEKKIISDQESLNMQIDYTTFINEIRRLNLQNEHKVVVSWITAKKKYDQYVNSLYRILELLLISAVPFVCWLISLYFINQMSKNFRGLFITASILYLSYFFPYIMVSVYTRYQIPFSAVYSLFIYFTIILIIYKIKRLRFPAVYKK